MNGIHLYIRHGLAKNNVVGGVLSVLFPVSIALPPLFSSCTTYLPGRRRVNHDECMRPVHVLHPRNMGGASPKEVGWNGFQ